MENPLRILIGTWEGDKGMDIAPEDGGQENNPYYETLEFTPVDIEIENADEEELLAVRYHQIVREIANKEVSHSEVGYWIWDKEKNQIMNSFSIPRGVCVLAGGKIEINQSEIKFDVSANIDSSDWGILQSPFMQKKAKTKSFKRKLTVNENKLSYEQEMVIGIYGNEFNHKDKNELAKIK